MDTNIKIHVHVQNIQSGRGRVLVHPNNKKTLSKDMT